MSICFPSFQYLHRHLWHVIIRSLFSGNTDNDAASVHADLINVSMAIARYGWFPITIQGSFHRFEVMPPRTGITLIIKRCDHQFIRNWLASSVFGPSQFQCLHRADFLPEQSAQCLLDRRSIHIHWFVQWQPRTVHERKPAFRRIFGGITIRPIHVRAGCNIHGCAHQSCQTRFIQRQILLRHDFYSLFIPDMSHIADARFSSRIIRIFRSAFYS